VKRAAGLFLSVLISLPMLAQLTPLGGSIDTSTPQVTLEGGVQSQSGDTVKGTITAKIAPTWHINSAMPLDQFSIPTTLKIDDGELVDAKFPPHEVKTFTFSSGSQVAVYQGTIQIPFTAKLKPGAKTIHATLHYQSCNDKVCLPPKNASVEFGAGVGQAPSPVPAPPPGVGQAPPPVPQGTNFTKLTAAPKETSFFDVKAQFASHGLPLTLFVVFLIGFGLNFTPCVYPVIPITIGYFGTQSGSSRLYRFLLSALYVLGLAITYSSLGAFAALSGRLFGAWLQLPAVLIFFALLMLVLASSMFGLFDITVPQFVTRYSGGQSGFAGALVMGLLIGIVAAPCVGPLVAALISLVAERKSIAFGVVTFFTLALGLGLPYLFLGIFTSAANSLPRAGMWMVQIKKGMGFILIAMAFYFLRPLTGDIWFRYGVAASLLFGALFLFASRVQGARTLRLSIAVILLVAGAAFAIPKSHESGPHWDAYEEKSLAAASAAQKPAIIAQIKRLEAQEAVVDQQLAAAGCH